MTESSNRSAFYAKPVDKISCDVRLIAEIMKFLAQDIVLQKLKPHAQLPRLAIRWNERRGSGGFTGWTAGIERRRGILC
jgi:hypothetical protein